MYMRELEDELFEDLHDEVSGQPGYSDEMLRKKIRQAIKSVKRARNYSGAGYSIDQIEEDIENYYSNIRDIALYDYNIIGAEGESYHYEGGTNRTYIDRRRLYNGIIPLVVIH